jgi:hypothetical protein
MASEKTSDRSLCRHWSHSGATVLIRERVVNTRDISIEGEGVLRYYYCPLCGHVVHTDLLETVYFTVTISGILKN